MRIVGGGWRGRTLVAPPGETTRPTSERARQALFDMLMHAPWASPDAVVGARVLDVFAGTGALGLEALSRGAAHATFVERDRVALAALRANIAACRAAQAEVIVADATALPQGPPCTLAFFDPPYGRDLVSRGLASARAAGRVAPGALIVAECARAESLPDLDAEILAERTHGAARLVILRSRMAGQRKGASA